MWQDYQDAKVKAQNIKKPPTPVLEGEAEREEEPWTAY
jgi:hypothetical protein